MDKETTSYPAIRGREQIVKDKLAAEGRGTKQIRPISPTNDRLQEYLDAATKEFGGN